MPDLTPELFLEIAKLEPKQQRMVLKEVGKAEFQRCADDIFYWLDPAQHMKTTVWPGGLPYVFTHDPHPMHRCRDCAQVLAFHKRDVHLTIRHKMPEKHISDGLTEAQYRAYFEILSPTRPFVPLCYMAPIIQEWLRKPLMVIEKSRDMMATWLVVTMYTWDTLFHEGKQNIFQSEDAGKTRELVKRAHFIYENQPTFLKDVHKAHWTSGANRSGELHVDSLNSEILGFPQGPDQIRQYHPSGIFTDETAFQIQAVDSFAAIKPAIQNGGRYTGVSSANPGWFQLVAQDRLTDL